MISSIIFCYIPGAEENTKYSLNNELGELEAGFIIWWNYKSLYHAGKRNKIPSLHFVAYPTTLTELFRLKPILKSSKIF